MLVRTTQVLQVKQIRGIEAISPEEFRRGLVSPPTFPWLSAEVSSERLLPVVQAQAPVDGREVVEWMQMAAAQAAVLEGASEDYRRLGSLLSWAANDPFLPGIRVGDLRVTSIAGSDVRRAGGATVITPRGNFMVPLPGKTTGIFSDILAWASLSWAGTVQWVLALLQWRELAGTPVRQRLRFPNLAGAVAPQFIVVRSRFPPPAMVLRMGFTSSRSQKMAFQMRRVADYTQVLASDTLDLPAGESEVIYLVYGIPFVEPFVAHFQPEDGTETVLDMLEVFPP